MVTITNYGSGEIMIEDGEGRSLRLDREAGNRLVMTGRMHTVAEFVEKLPSFVTEPILLASILAYFEKAANASEKWNLKEKFARLGTLTKGYEPKNPSEVVETVSL